MGVMQMLTQFFASRLINKSTHFCCEAPGRVNLHHGGNQILGAGINVNIVERDGLRLDLLQHLIHILQRLVRVLSGQPVSFIAKRG